MVILPKMAYLAKMAEMAINRQNRQTVNNNSNEMAKGPLAIKGGGRPTRVLPHAKMLLIPMKLFLFAG